jgi:integrative and conjugative element protein (TIGR02256 family)
LEVVFSKRAMVALLVETRENIKTETGGVFLGKYQSGVWYIVETIDPGPNSIFMQTYFEYDTDYINHIINKISRLYRNQLDLIGLWHRHPGSLDTFSMTDDGTNMQFAKLSEQGAISGLVNIDPEFRLTMYHVSYPHNYEKIHYLVDDDKIPNEINELLEPSKYTKLLGKIYKKITQNRNLKNHQDKIKCKNVVSSIHEYLKKRTISDIEPLNAKGYDGDLPIEDILEVLQIDLDYFDENEISYSMMFGKSGLLDLHIKSEKKDICLNFGMTSNKMVVFVYNEITYKYFKGLLLNAIKG